MFVDLQEFQVGFVGIHRVEDPAGQSLNDMTAWRTGQRSLRQVYHIGEVWVHGWTKAFSNDLLKDLIPRRLPHLAKQSSIRHSSVRGRARLVDVGW